MHNRLEIRRRLLGGTSWTALFLIAINCAIIAPSLAQIAASNPPAQLSPRQSATPNASVADSEPAPQDRDAEPADQSLPNMQVFEGTGAFVNSATAKTTVSQKGDVTLDFTNADIRDVVRAVFGDILQKSYTIDPKVTGRMTLKTGRPIPKGSVLPALETALRMSGAAINRSQDIYNIVPLGDITQNGQIAYGTDESQSLGYGIEIVPLEYVSAEEIQRVITPLVPDKSIVQIDVKRNLIFLSGTEPERAAIRATIARFDVNYLKGMSFALIQPTHASAESLAAELDKIFGEANSPIAGLVRLVPIPRINSLLVITARRNYLREVQRWVGRLDVAPVTPDRKLYFYRLQNARARDIADILGRVFGNGTGTGETPTASTSAGAMGISPGPTSSTRTTTRFLSQSGARESAFTAPPGDAVTTPARQYQSGTSSEDARTPQIVTDEANNALIIRADATDYAAIEDVIKQMDVAPAQVMVEATIVEVTLNDTLKYGVEWYFKNNSQTYTMSPNGAVSAHYPGLGITYTVPNINAALSTLGSLTNVTVISSPKILTLDNRAATIEVGDQIPIVTQTAVSTTDSSAPIVSNVQQRDTGVILDVTPRIGNSGIVYLDVSQEVSTSAKTTTSDIDSPTIQQRRLKTTVAVYDGATIALGGLIQRSEDEGDSGIPYLKDIPLLGAAFSTKTSTRGRTELLIFLTPHVIRNLPAALNVTEKLKQEMEDVRNALADVPSHHNPRRPW